MLRSVLKLSGVRRWASFVPHRCAHLIVVHALTGRGPIHATIHSPSTAKHTLAVSLKDDTTAADSAVCPVLSAVV